ncbi:helix-turn-helix domain-containing protein [Oceanivirga miroungae]|uniref:HTH crp-type domain-containing protein n=1 Tax=Oceanivirga miroungae TaxID=1130046 RepID=A0A6I8MC02_9FUSO|nr:hypothetical protein [Oceanivirga miroungae]VWL84979.1 hypothetical protein OMES3154_00251 [Oceanivirga miroungae]
MGINLFLNDYYKLLKTLKDNEIQVGEVKYCPLSQTEIGKIVGFNQTKVFKMLQVLREQNYVIVYKDLRGKYQVSEKGIKIINFMEKGVD